MSCPNCSSGSTHDVGLGHICENCRKVWLVQGELTPDQAKQYEQAAAEESEGTSS